MSSGVKVNKECYDEYENLKMRHQYRYILFKLSDNMKEIVVDCTAPPEKTYGDLKQALLDHAENRQCRYAVVDLEFEHQGQKKQKIVFIAWNPENAIVKQKMVYTSSKDYIKKALEIAIELQANDSDDISEDNIVEKAARHLKD